MKVKKKLIKNKYYLRIFLEKIGNNRVIITVVFAVAILMALIIWTITSNKEVIISGGSTSVSSVLSKITQQIYKDKNIDVVYNALGSSAAKAGVKNKSYVFGFLSEDINLTSKNNCGNNDGGECFSAKKFWNDYGVNCFAFARDYILLVYNLPKGCSLLNDQPLNFGSFFGGLGTLKIRDIYSYKKLSWQEVFPGQINCLGSPNASFYTITREAGSGTRDFFENNIIKSRNYFANRVVSSNGDMYQAISSTPGSIGYLSFSYLKKIADDPKLGLKFVFSVTSNNGCKEFPYKIDEFNKPVINFYTNSYEFNPKYSLTRLFTGIFNVNHYYFKTALKFISWMLDPKPYYEAKVLKIKKLTLSDAAYWYLKEGISPLTQEDLYFNKYNNNTLCAIKNWGFNKDYRSIWELAVNYFNYSSYMPYNEEYKIFNKGNN